MTSKPGQLSMKDWKLWVPTSLFVAGGMVMIVGIMMRQHWKEVKGTLIQRDGKYYILDSDGSRLTNWFTSDDKDLAINETVTMWVEDTRNMGSKEKPTKRIEIPGYLMASGGGTMALVVIIVSLVFAWQYLRAAKKKSVYAESSPH